MHNKKNRKGQGFVEIFAWITAFFVTVLFFVLMNLPSCTGPPEQKITSKNLIDLKVNYDLEAYMRTPVAYNGANLTVSDLVVLAMENPAEKTSLVYTGSPLVLQSLNIPAMSSAFTQYFSATINYPLSFTAANLLKTYSEYFPSLANRKLICSYNVYARKGADEITLFDSRYAWYDKISCLKGSPIASAKIPGTDGNIITVEIAATINTRRIALATVTGPLFAELLGIY